MKIGKVSKQTGVSQRMIRHFESLGIITPKRSGPYRSYSDTDCETIKKIRTFQNLGLSLKEVKNSLSNDKLKLEQNLLDVISRNHDQTIELQEQRKELINSLQNLKISTSQEKLLNQGLIMKFVESFEEVNVIRGRMPYLEVLYENFANMYSNNKLHCRVTELHSTDILHIHDGVEERFKDDLKIIVSSKEQQFRNSFVFFLSPQLLKLITGEEVEISSLDNNKDLNLRITSWVNEAISKFNHSWNGTFTIVKLENYGMLKENDDLKKLYHDDEIFILTSLNTGKEEERISIGLPYRYISIIYNILKK